ncbi:transcription factor subunit Med10 of mediator complex-domain-containing protein [Sphaerosporella brunnea]|uniref:Mediator of RNA polymerase II transcription subunit 10 n=1 Tax=Sphaerosporella brunnea TaxID=1250544 RepID=A0A5J5EEI5_9PEZI|nr:transcription factor subunit Med10 of mediator complex-domain-containing protein [Sphaerosporella brunnea]
MHLSPTTLPHNHHHTKTMAPPTVPVPGGNLPSIERETQRIIQTLFELQVKVHGFEGPESTDIVADSIKDLVAQFQHINNTSAATTATLPREVIQYVEDGRNPDIYTREFVELVSKSNQQMNGKRRAFRRFRDVLAEQMVVGFPELKEEVEKIVDNIGGR